MAWASAQERDDAIRNAHSAGRSTKWMRRELKVGSVTITKALRSIGIAVRSHAYSRIDWTEEKIETLKKLWAEGASYSDIAQATDATRRTVERKGQQLGLAPKAAAPDGPKKKAGAHVRRRPPVARLPRSAERPYEPPSLDLSLMDLNPFHCRWITSGDGACARFCGHVAIKAYGYCPAHHSIAYVRPETYKPRARTDYHLYRRAA